MADADRKTGAVIATRYTLERQLGEGAFGEVWIASDAKAFGRHVAVKFLLQQHLANEEVVRRFWQEGQATAALSHPNVVALLEFGEDHGVPYLVSEFVEGEPLRKVLDRASEERRLLSADEALSVFRQACAGVLAAHQKNIVHRDLKPENIMVQGIGSPAVMVKVLDFGVARILGKDSSHSLGRTEVGKIIGSIQYMSPEQVLGDVRSIDRRTDIFAMAAVLFEMLAQRAAFDGSTYQEVIGKILDPTRPKLAALRADLGPSLDPVFEKAFAMHRDQRYDTVAALLEAVEQALEEHIRPRRTTGVSRPIVAVPDLAGPWGHKQSSGSEANDTETVETPVEELRKSTARRSDAPEESDDDHDHDQEGGSRSWLVFVGVFLVVAVGGSVVGALWVKRRNAALDAAADAGAVVAAGSDASSPRAVWTPPPEDPTRWALVAAPAAPVTLGRAAETDTRGGFLPSAHVQFSGPAFRIMKREVTFGEYEAWSESNHEHRLMIPPWVPSLPEARAALPAVNVAWSSATAYCAAIGGSLPTEEQWEFAGRRGQPRVEPWDGPAPAGLPAFAGGAGRLLPAGSFAADTVQDEIAGLATNGQEWTSSSFRDDDGRTPNWQQPYRTVRGLPLRETLPAGTAAPAGLLYRNAGCASAACSPAERLLLENVGFRCVKTVS
ncbi:MAG: protein kinase [Myxococcales bacterium]|nr:protein kinase [Myxococcales bacterium]